MIDFLKNLLLPTPITSIGQSIIIISVTIALGILLGRIKFGKIAIGVAGIFFSGLLMGHLGYRVSSDILDFLKDFGLVLFVYAMGLQVGPSFFASFKKEGILFNTLAIGSIVLTVGITAIIMQISGESPENMAGIMSGAVMSMPSLFSASSTLQDISANTGISYANPANGCAIAYPFGILGVIFVIILVKNILHINESKELNAFEEQKRKQYPHPSVMKCRVTNADVFGKNLKEVLSLMGEDANGLIVSRLKNSGSKTVIAPNDYSIINERDVLMLVGMPHRLKKAKAILGRESTDTFVLSDEEIESREIIVTNKKAVQQTIAQLNYEGLYNVKITRIFRTGIAFMATPDFVLHFGDEARVVGPKESVEQVIKALGNSTKKLQEPEFVTIFVGVILGMIVGSIPIAIPSLPVPVKLGVATGPLLVAIVISRFGGVSRSLHSYMNQSVMLFMRDIGIFLFFAAVGITAGKDIYYNFMHNNGWNWVFYGSLITIIPATILAIVARLVFKINFTQIAGLISGAYTNPTALTFSNNYLKTDVVIQAYTTVYPMTTICRILAAQLFLLMFMR